MEELISPQNQSLDLRFGLSGCCHHPTSPLPSPALANWLRSCWSPGGRAGTAGAGRAGRGAPLSPAEGQSAGRRLQGRHSPGHHHWGDKEAEGGDGEVEGEGATRSFSKTPVGNKSRISSTAAVRAALKLIKIKTPKSRRPKRRGRALLLRGLTWGVRRGRRWQREGLQGRTHGSHQHRQRPADVV